MTDSQRTPDGWTPTTDMVRARYSWDPDPDNRTDLSNDFYRWLTKHDAMVAGEAWVLGYEHGRDEWEHHAQAAQAEARDIRSRADLHVKSLVAFAETAPTQESQYDATMTARLIEHIVSGNDEDCGPCSVLGVDA